MGDEKVEHGGLGVGPGGGGRGEPVAGAGDKVKRGVGARGGQEIVDSWLSLMGTVVSMSPCTVMSGGTSWRT